MSTTIDGTAGITFPDTSVQPKSGYGPAFSAYQSVAQTLGSGVNTKLSFQTKEYDTANAFSAGTVVTNGDTTNRFTPQVAGYYQINAAFAIGSTATATVAVIYKNGTVYKSGTNPTASSNNAIVAALVFFNGSTDYVEIYGYAATGQVLAAAINTTYFQGIFIRGA